MGGFILIIMKKLIIIPFLLISLILQATNYYVKTGGDDGKDGKSDANAWLTVTKVNTVWDADTFAPGDSILFNRGDTFSGTITVTESGSSGSPIIVGAYGTGADPIITGFSTLSSWTDEGGSIYSKTVALASSTYINVSVDGVNTAIGRYPNYGTWLSIDSHSTNVSLTDAAIDKAVTDWEGAEVVIRLQEFWADARLTISDHTSHTLTFTAARYNLTDGNGYFIQNDLATLDATNEWYYDGSKFYIFGNPAAKTVKVSSVLNGVIINSFDYITFDNINFTGFGGNCFTLTDASNITIQNCSISFCGKHGIQGVDETSGASGSCVINANIINDIDDCGILLSSQFQNVTISNNTIYNCGLNVGASQYHGAYPTSRTGVSIFWCYTNTASTIEYNTVYNIAYSGIQIYGHNVTTQYNEVHDFCLRLQDGGGIYTYNESTTDATTVGTIKQNIVYNGIGNHEGMAHNSYHYANGVYVDGYSRGITVDGNTAFNCNGTNMHCNGNRSGSFINNTAYNSVWADNFTINDFSALIDVHANMTVKNNILFARDITERSFFYLSRADSLSKTAVIDSNYYAKPINNLTPILLYYPTTGSLSKTLAQWQSFSSQDANSSISPIAVTDTADIDFYYNASTTPDTIVLDTACIDVTGTKYADTLILAAYTSAVLMVDPDPEPDPPDIPVITTTAAVGRSKEMALGGSGISAGGGTITAKGICYSQKSIPVVTDSTFLGGTGTDAFSVRITGLTPGTTYYARAYATNAAGIGYGGIQTVTTPASSPVQIVGKLIKHGNYYIIH
jgi:hypothetical protein